MTHQPSPAHPDAPPLMLSVSGCRGVVGETMTPGVVARFAGALAAYLDSQPGPAGSGDTRSHSSGGAPNGHGSSKRRVVVARDGRAGGHALMHAAIGTLTGAGWDVIDLGVAMTPTVGVMVDHLGAKAGLVITASHNPQEWNGLKPILPSAGRPPGGTAARVRADASAPDPGRVAEIIAAFHANRQCSVTWDRVGSVRSAGDEAMAVHQSLVMAALERVVSNAGRVGHGMTAAIDTVNGAGRRAGPGLLRSLGCRVVYVGDEDDESGVFPHAPEPTRENLAGRGGLCDAVRESGAAVGFAQDPDADRLAVIDEHGNYIGEEYTLVLAARAVVELGLGADAPRRAIVVNLSTSRMIEDAAAVHGVSVVRSPVGEANVVDAMRRHGSFIGGEGNGGVIWPEVTYIRDSLSGMALILALLKQSEKTVSQLVAEMPAYAIVKRKMDLARATDAEPVLRRVRAAYANETVDLQDGVRVDMPSRGAWAHVRPSNTEPILRVIVEARTAAEAERIADEVAAAGGV